MTRQPQRWNPLHRRPRSEGNGRDAQPGLVVSEPRSSPAAPLDLRLESRPTPWFPMLLGGSVSVLVLTTLAAAALVKVDQVVTAPGTLRTLRSTQDIKPDQPGIVTEVLVREGQTVQRNAPLVMLDTTVLRGRQQALASQRSQLRASSEAEERRLEGALAQLNATETGLRSQLAINDQQLQSVRALERQGAATRFQVLEYEKVEAQLQAQLRQNDEERGKLQAESQQRQAELARTDAENLASTVENREQLRRVILRAPVDGTILNLKAKSAQVVGAGEVLLQLVPTDSLRAEAFVSNQDLAFVRKGQTADIALQAYDRSTYGTIRATVSTIGTDALPPDENFNFTRFPIGLSLTRQYLESQGKRYPLQAGMALTADLRLEKRTVLELFSSAVMRKADAVRTIR
jgi:HlyD family secretion protein